MAAIEARTIAHKFRSRKPSETFYNPGANSMVNYNVIPAHNSLVAPATRTPKPIHEANLNLSGNKSSKL